MKIYIAAPYAARDDIRAGLLPYLEKSGHTVTSSWLQETKELTAGALNAAKDHPDAEVHAQAWRDLEDVDSAEALVLLTSKWITQHYETPKAKTISGGRHIETGYAIAKGRIIIVMGEVENIFHRSHGKNLQTLADLNDHLLWLDSMLHPIDKGETE